MNIDEGAFLVLQNATGAFSCSAPNLPHIWTDTKRPYVALLIKVQNTIQRLMLSHPHSDDTLEISELENLPESSIIEIRVDSREYSYYRKDNETWTKVGAAQDPFLVEVYSQSGSPLVMNMVLGMPT